ncbi:hypothetical protein HPB48_011141 [Haemaphysalis longicornis]|uniref:Uncharacterized protein n=1 Tax=Haemaphysalis longicornis TaxID=44386 RepID=A0A9J6GI09_HAELO|nr:hypothetical protein HPB48_011141 [Haemaphysalis longicornis]
MPPPRHHYFNVRVPSGTAVDAIIDAAEVIVPTSDLYSVQHMGGLDFQIRVNTQAAVRKLLGRKRSTHWKQPSHSRASEQTIR